jgi:hypothetical protein
MSAFKPATLNRGNISASSRLFEVQRPLQEPASEVYDLGAVKIRLLQR